MNRYLRRRVSRAAVSAGPVIAALLAGIPGAWAGPLPQSGTEIHYGETVSSEITENTACRWFWFEGSAGDAITLDMVRTAGNLDGVMALYLQDSADPLAFSDDRKSGGLDPLIETTLPDTGWYTVAACRLVHENMRATTGTFTLTLTGPIEEEAAGDAPGGAESAAPTPTPPQLTDGLFGDESGEGSSAEPPLTPTPGGFTEEILPGTTPDSETDAAGAMLDPGETVSGRLESDVKAVTYTIQVYAGATVTLDWTRLSGDVAPQITVSDEGGTVIAQAGTPDQDGSAVQLVFTPQADATLTVAVMRFGGITDQTSSDYALGFQVTITDTEPPNSIPLD